MAVPEVAGMTPDELSAWVETLGDARVAELIARAQDARDTLLAARDAPADFDRRTVLDRVFFADFAPVDPAAEDPVDPEAWVVPTSDARVDVIGLVAENRLAAVLVAYRYDGAGTRVAGGPFASAAMPPLLPPVAEPNPRAYAGAVVLPASFATSGGDRAARLLTGAAGLPLAVAADAAVTAIAFAPLALTIALVAAL